MTIIETTVTYNVKTYIYTTPWKDKFPFMFGYMYPNIGNSFRAVQEHANQLVDDICDQAIGQIHVDYDGDLFRGSLSSIMRHSQVLIHLTEADQRLFMILKLSS